MSRKIIIKRTAFVGMILLILISAGLAFTVMRKEKPGQLPKMPGMKLPPVSGLGKTMIIYKDLEQLEVLGQEVKEILKKNYLTDADSMILKSKLKQIDSIYKRANAH
uniref:hypothetical protein n=1 Tax=Pedobacter schmidteae TaxID=2201271 RepID=UPI000EAFE4D5|nr:hypothetical protein [Pedobacter schmidteae]